MYESFWGLNASPFTNRLNTKWFHESPVHEEGIARLFYLIEQQRSFGLLTGESGTGKSMLFRVLIEQIQRSGRHSACVNLLGMDQHEMLWQTAMALQLSPKETETRWSLWRRIEDEIAARQQTAVRSVVLFDHLDQADSTCVGLLQRLLSLAQDLGSRTTLIASIRTENMRRFAGTVGIHSDLTIELQELELAETEEFIANQIARAGGTREVFDGESIIRLHEHSRGIPRAINRLCELSMIAALAASSDVVTAEIVDSVAEGLVMPFSTPVEAGSFQYA